MNIFNSKKRHLLFFIATFLIIFPSAFTHAIDSKEFINLLSGKIYEDCNGTDIVLRNDSFLVKNLLLKHIEWQTPENLARLRNGLNITLTREHVYDLVQELKRIEPFDEYQDYPENPQRASATGLQGTLQFKDGTEVLIQGKPMNFFSSGLGILSCGNNKLDVLGHKYYWNQKLIDLPKVTNNYNFTLLGLSIIADSKITVIGLTLFSFGIFSFSLTSISIILLLIPFTRIKMKAYFRGYVSKDNN